MAVKYKTRHPTTQQRAVISTADQNDLPDSCFAYVEPGKKDASGRTVPRSNRHLLYKKADGSIDLPHLRNALARLSQTNISAEAKAKAQKKLEAAARTAGVGDDDTDTPQGADRMTTPTLPIAPEERIDPLDLLARARDTYLEVAAAIGIDPLDALQRAAKAAANADDEEETGDEEDDEASDDEDNEDEEGDDEDEAEAPPPAKKKAKRAQDVTVPDPQDLLRQARAIYEQAAHANGIELDLPSVSTPATPPVTTRAVEVKAFTTPNLAELAYIPITRIDEAKWEVEGVLSDEGLDTFNTVFDYDSMKRAVNERWHGNVREQHDAKKAIGKGVFVFCDDDTRQVTVRSRISRGAPDTWQKVLDGVLCGYSVGAANAKTETRMVKTPTGDKTVPCYKDFDLAEISLVDAPSNPGAARSGLTIYRSAAAAATADDEYADVLAADAAETPSPAAVLSATSTPPVTEEEIAARVADAEAALMRGEAFGVPQMTAGTPAANDTPAGTPAEPTGEELDRLDAAMHQETGMAHAHSHAYTPSTVHMDENLHHHGDGTQHAHPHLHGHVGHGDGTTPHVHGHEHDHNFQRAAADLKGDGFIGEGDSRMLAYMNQVLDGPPPAALPKTAKTEKTETSGTPTSAPSVQISQASQPAASPVLPPTFTDGATPQRAQAPQPVDVTRIQEPADARVGMRISGDTRTGLHEGALAILRTCDCPACQEAIHIYDPDDDGDDDLDAAGDTDGDAMAVMPRVQHAALTRAVRGIVQQQMQQQTQPILTQFRALAARLAGVQTPDLPRFQTQLDSVCADLSATKDLVQRIAAQEQSGAPVVRAVDRSQAASGAPAGMTPFTPDQLAFLRKQNLLHPPTADQQTALAQTLIRQQLAQMGQ
jgi:hypothetical protein